MIDVLIASARDADIAEIATRLGARLKRVTSAELAGPCPACGGTDRFSVNTRRRLFNCRGAGGGDIFAMVQHALETDFRGAVGFITGADCGEPSRPSEQAAVAAKTDDSGRGLWLWMRRLPITPETPAWRYIREARGYAGPLPASLGYLSPSGIHPPSLIAAFALANEPEPGVPAIANADVRAVHITRLALDGSGKAETEPNKITIGTGAMGTPIVIAPPNDLIGLAITEGIEDALSIHAATGLGAWAAGTANRMPALADTVPKWIDCVTIMAHLDPAGIRYAEALLAGLRKRGIEASIAYLGAAE